MIKNILFISFIIRIIFLLTFKNVDNFDLRSYEKIGKLTLQNINIYPSPADINHPYFPFYLYLEAISNLLNKIGINSILLLKFINIVFDIGIILLIYLISKNIKKCLWYSLNPIPILISTLHGQFDSIPIFFLLLSVYFLKKKQILSILSYSFSIMTKTWPIIFLIIFFNKIKSKKLNLLIMFFPLISILLYLTIFKSNFINILKTISSYQGLYGLWGVGIILSSITNSLIFKKIFIYVFLLSLFIYSYLIKNRKLLNKFYSLLLFFYCFTPNFSIQYFSWFMPFLIIENPKKVRVFTILISLTLLSYYIVWIIYPNQSTPLYIKIFEQLIQFLTWAYFLRSFFINELRQVMD